MQSATKNLEARPWCSFCKHYGRGQQSRLGLSGSLRLPHRDHQHSDHRQGRYLCDVPSTSSGTRASGRLCRLTGVEFLRRFLMHVLPKGFHKLRYYGLWHHSKHDLQERARLLLSLLTPVRRAEGLLIADVAAESHRLSEGKNAPEEALSPSCPEENFSPSCPHCGSDRVQHLQERRRGPGP